MAAAWPDVVQYLVTTLPTLPSWSTAQVFDGPKDTGDDPSDYCTVGYVADDSAGAFTQSHDGEDFQVLENGTVRLDITSKTGDPTLSGVRSRVFELFAALDAHLRADQMLGGLLARNATVLLTSDGIQVVADSSGTLMTIACTVAYTTQTLNA